MKTYSLHPISNKYIRQGHPWVTLDEYSKKFARHEQFIVSKGHTALLIHDPDHNQIRARVWSLTGNFEEQIRRFPNELEKRINEAIEKRTKNNFERENFYLCFGESDRLPGLFIQKLGDHLLIQYFAFYWQKYSKDIVKILQDSMQEYYKEKFIPENIWIQMRAGKQEAPTCFNKGQSFSEFTLKEFGLNYKIKLGDTYDHGLYTDMAAIRQQTTSFIGGAKTFLNLYSYTGAYSLFALSLGVAEVHSVDLSKKYLNWLEENLELNSLEGNHHSHLGSVKEKLNAFSKEGLKFDAILSDPPSSSSDGKKKTNAINSYKRELPLMCELLNKGGHLIVFLNTHQVSPRKFQQKILDILKEKKLKLKVIKTLRLSQDCPTHKGFPEGDYLKGIVLQKL